MEHARYVPSPDALLTKNNSWTGSNDFQSLTGNHRPIIGPDGQYFGDGSAGTPTGWTVVDTANTSNQNDDLGMWYQQNNVGASFDYYKPVSGNLGGGYRSFEFLQIRVRNFAFTADQDIYYGIYGDDGSGIDDDIFLRCQLQYDSSSAAWQARGQAKDGTTLTEGGWEPLDNFHPRDMFARVVYRTTSNSIRVYLGNSEYPNQQKQIWLSSLDRTVWDNGVYFRYQCDHGGGSGTMYTHIGAIDEQSRA